MAGVLIAMTTAHRSHRFRLYPNKEQRQQLAPARLGAVATYNWALRRRSDEYHTAGKSLSFAEISRDLTALKKDEETEWLGEVSAVVLQQSLRNLDTSFTNFFEGKTPPVQVEEAEQANRPLRRDGLRAERRRLAVRRRCPGLVKVRWSRELPSVPSSCTVTLDPGRTV